MKYYQWLSFGLFFLAAGAGAFEPKLEIFEQFDNLRVVAFISEEDISDNPVWNPVDGAPPLTVAEAISATRRFSSASEWSGIIEEIEIRQLTDRPGHWHYLIKTASELTASNLIIYVVLMNGKVIPAIIEPQSIK